MQTSCFFPPEGVELSGSAEGEDGVADVVADGLGSEGVDCSVDGELGDASVGELGPDPPESCTVEPICKSAQLIPGLSA